MPPINLDEIVSRALNQPQRSNAVASQRVSSTVEVVAEPRQPVIAIVITEPDKLLGGDSDWINLIEIITAACQVQGSLCALYLLDPGSAIPETLYTALIEAVIIIGQPANAVIVQLQTRRPTALLIEPPARQ